MRFEDVSFGEDLPALEPDVSAPTVQQFARAAGMLHPRFFDDDAARREGLPGAIVPGIMSQGILAALIHRWAPDAQIELLDTTFRAPLRVGSKPTARGVVTDLDAERRTVEIDLTLANEAGETRVVGTARVALP
ncbi:MAG TPA: MaoC/PaaZ C-terminal domain-containing protein [Myxococcota bacterium]|jgi:acyl dehydratase|nr:MaoC/PaaZ C-terminal domain-containing protein [Myxococcota bacterium]